VVRQSFGGDWTEDKLSRVGEYLGRYNLALKNQLFSREYIDGFAGTGYREVRDSVRGDSLMFPELAEPEVQRFLDGSARIALKAEPCFHKFTFIEKDPRKVEQLKKLRDEFPDKSIRIECGDANEWVQGICREDWNNRRAVLFLDPFGMQVSWQTLEAIARTKCIDLWLLFPLGVAISRLLRRDGDIDEALCRRLDFVFGDRSWRQSFYKAAPPIKAKAVQRSLSLGFEDDAPQPEYPCKADFRVIEDYFRSRLRSIFAKVAENSVRLTNSKGVPLYLLFFMAGNERGAPIAVKIAESIMSKP
jgi:three-Cys-motif partner protein